MNHICSNIIKFDKLLELVYSDNRLCVEVMTNINIFIDDLDIKLKVPKFSYRQVH